MTSNRTDKALTIHIKGDSTQLGAATKQAANQLNEVKSAAQSMLAAFTGGVLGGSVIGVVEKVVSMVGQQIKEAKQLLRDARTQDLSKDFLAGARFFSERISGDPKLVESAIKNARQARSDALTGDDNAIAMWQRLGVSLKEIENLQPDELFERIFKVFKDSKGGPLSQERLQGAAGIMGLNQANALLPYMAGGSEGSIHMRELFLGDYSNWFLRNSAIYGSMQENILTRPAWKRSMEPISMAGIGNEEAAARIRQQAQDIRNQSLREEMTIQQRLMSMLEERTELEKRMTAEPDSVKKARLELRISELDAEAGTMSRELNRKQVQDILNSRPAVSDQDSFAMLAPARGFEGRGLSLQEKQLAAAQELVRLTASMHADQVKNWG